MDDTCALFCHPNPNVFYCFFQVSGISFRSYQFLVWVSLLDQCPLSASTSQVASLEPPTDLWPHSFLCPLSLKLQVFWAPRVVLKGVKGDEAQFSGVSRCPAQKIQSHLTPLSVPRKLPRLRDDCLCMGTSLCLPETDTKDHQTV